MKLLKNVLGKTLVIASILVLMSFFGTICSAEVQDDYAPILYFEGEENCYPVSVDYLFDIIGDYTQYSTISISGQDVPFFDNTSHVKFLRKELEKYREKD